MIPTYLPVWRNDHEHRGGAVQPGHPDTAGHEVQPDLHNAGSRFSRGHQRISWHRVSHHLLLLLQKLTFSTFDPAWAFTSCSTLITRAFVCVCVFFCVSLQHIVLILTLPTTSTATP